MSSVLDNIADVKEESKQGSRAFVDPQLEEQCPDLFAWLSTDEFRGQPRRLPTLTFFVDDGRLKCVINERSQDLTGFWSFKTAFGCWRELQEALSSDNIEWRKARDQNGRRK